MEEYTIGEMAKFFGVSRDTLRLYDRMGIVSPEKKANRYRCYSRNNMIALAYVMYLRKTELSLEQIRILVNETDIENSQKMLCEQEKILQSRIEHLQNIKNIVHKHTESFKYCVENQGIIKTVDNISFIVSEINDIAVANPFASLNKKYKFNFSFIGKQEMFLLDRVDNPMELILKLNYAVTSVFENDSEFDPLDFPSEFYTIIEFKKYVFSVIRCQIPDDYDEFNNVLTYIKEHNLTINGDIIIRNLSLRNGPGRDIDYYEVYIPVY